MNPLNFTPINSFVQASFWHKLSGLKITVDKLSENEREITGFYSNISSTWNSQILEVDSSSFNTSFSAQNNNLPFHGKIFNKNTIEQFKDCDKNQLITNEGRRFLEEIKSGKVLEKPSRLNQFFIISFCDLKKYHFYYWFAFPVPHNLQVNVSETGPISQLMPLEQLGVLCENYFQLDAHQRSFFLIHGGKVATLQEKLSAIDETNFEEYYFAFSDFQSDEGKPRPQLKNYIVLIWQHCPFLRGKTTNFLAFSLDRKLNCLPSVFYKITLPQEEDLVNAWTGWEKNENHKFGPRFANMKTTMDPAILFEESVDLNLKLMKWRLLPDIDLDKIKKTKFLLLGAGTLGCSVARNLLGWGVRNITFVDNSTVSYSNPVRQHLFYYEDAINGRPKAETAAVNLTKIFPAINAQGRQFTIPMPGHSIGEPTLQSTKENVEELQKLIEENDVIFLLTDSRESRWLPTLLGVTSHKIIINVALGFDSYLIMRYGRNEEGFEENQPPSEGYRTIAGAQLGCYFCNDVTAPGNSMKDRTLDQQCTVTRPGVSSIAGALAVELAIGILQHKEGIAAPAFYKLGPQTDMNESASEEQGMLGVLPHSIRGFLSTFTHVLPATPKYDHCIACSDTILAEFKSKGFAFLLESFNSAKYLENLTGLSSLLNDANFTDVLEISDSEWED